MKVHQIRAEIERRLNEEPNPKDVDFRLKYTRNSRVAIIARRCVLEEVLRIINSTLDEQPEVDLEEEITRFFNQLAIDESLQDGVSISKFDLVRTARHFAEWGAIHLNARKEDEK